MWESSYPLPGKRCQSSTTAQAMKTELFLVAWLNQNIDMTKLKESYKWSGVWQEKGLALVPKKTRVDWGAARKMGVALVP